MPKGIVMVLDIVLWESFKIPKFMLYNMYRCG